MDTQSEDVLDVESEKAGAGSQGYIPFEYYVDFLRLIADNKDLIKVITYNDLCWEGDFDYQKNYPTEHAVWKQALAAGKLDKSKIYVLIQHDVDSNPARTMDALRTEAQYGIASNVMIFNKRISRRYLKAKGDLLYTDYPLDYEYLKCLQDNHGFVIGYHCNAFERGLFDFTTAEQVFENDIRELREHFDINFFSPHGGTPGPDNLNNHDLHIPESLLRSLRWVHNRHTPWFSGGYSDGGINSPKRDPEKRDLRDFVRTWQPGGRYRVLTHPQYYMDNCGRSPRLSGAQWYEEILAAYASGRPAESPWLPVNRDIRGGKPTRKTPMIEKLKRILIHKAARLEWIWRLLKK